MNPTKTILITGSTRGIGLGLAIEFLKRGHNVVISGRAQNSVDHALADLTNTYNPQNLFGYPCDVTRLEQVEALWQAAATHFERVDIWINNAGITHPQTNIWDIGPATVQAIVQTNLLGTYHGCRVAIREMLKQGGGQVYNLEGFGSSGSVRAGLGIYGTTKASITYLSKALAAELKGTPVLLGTLQPGMVATELVTDQYKDKPEDWQRVKKIFNIFVERVETVTPYLVEHILANTKNGAHISFSSQLKLTWRFMTAPFVKRNVFD
ncbi:MAG: SDR family oxidoreductase [Anaerolineales bacterium]|nr:SDR family oxidoreductase [Anaerolineales bacterium]